MKTKLEENKHRLKDDFVVIGDIHGCAKELEELLGEIDKEHGSRIQIVALGDMFTKGPDPAGVMRLIEEWGIVCMQGNHEQMMANPKEKPKDAVLHTHYKLRKAQEKIDANRSDKSEMLGKAFDERYGERNDRSLEREIIAFSWRCQKRLENKNAVIVHAYLDPKKTTDGQETEVLTGTCEKPPDGWPEELAGSEKVVYFGHRDMTKNGKPYIKGNLRGIDTGCVKGGKLTAIHHGSGNIIQVEAHENYEKLDKAAIKEALKRAEKKKSNPFSSKKKSNRFDKEIEETEIINNKEDLVQNTVTKEEANVL